MDIIELKEAISKDTLPEDFLILICEDNYFLADQYIEELCAIRNLDCVSVDSLDFCEQTNTSLLGNQKLYVLKVDTFTDERSDFTKLDNTIVVCKALGKKVHAKAKEYSVKMPKPADWQVADYIRLKCGTLTEPEALELYNATGKNIYKTMLAIDQLLLFTGEDRRDLLRILIYNLQQECYTDNYYHVAELIATKNKTEVLDFLKHYEVSDLDAFYLYTIVLDNLKKALFIQYTEWSSCTDLKLTSGQVHAISQKYAKALWPLNELQEAISILSKLDLDFKSGRLDLDKKAFLEYIICKLFD